MPAAGFRRTTGGPTRTCSYRWRSCGVRVSHNGPAPHASAILPASAFHWFSSARFWLALKIRAPVNAAFPIPQSPFPRRRDAITDAGLAHFQAAYPGESLSKEGIFYYVYGLLHSPDYRARYADNLSKELPRIPCVKSAADFWAFSRAGRRLADLHINYETVDPYPVTITGHQNALTPEQFYRVEKMRFPKNAWALETMHDPRYPLDLFCCVITVSLETMKIVNGLPGLDI